MENAPTLRQREFGPEMQPTEHEVKLLESAGFEDDSWHNNICVSFTKACTFHNRPDGTTITIWIDAINPDNREMTAERFMVIAYDEMEPLGDEFCTDSLTEALEVAAEVFESHEAVTP